MSGKGVVAALAVILLATAVVPPLMAYGVNRARVRAALMDLERLAEALRTDPEWRALARSAGVLCGPGRVPRALSSETHGWVTAPRLAVDGLAIDGRAVTPDPWGNCYLVDLAAPGTAMRVISAGPDGIVETPFVATTDLAVGNDVSITLR